MFPELNMNLFYNWIIAILFLIAGIYFLVKCSDIFVDGASTIAKKLNISSLVIGLTVVAIGTSLPELAVSCSDSISCLLNGGNANVAIGNIVGSNICNILLVLGFSVLFTKIAIKKNVLKKELPILIFVSLIFVVFGIFFSLNGQYAILRWEGIILFILMFVYLAYIVIDAKHQRKNSKIAKLYDEEIKLLPTWKAILFLFLGLVGIVIGGELVVYSAKALSTGFGDLLGLNHDLVESLVSLTVVAVGTSLPELVTSIVASKKNQNELALGNVIGSNIFNILLIIGLSATVCPLTVGSQIIIDFTVLMGSAILLFIFSLKGHLDKKNGIIFICIYVLYLIYLILRTVL